MRKQVVIVGHSPLSQFLAKELDQTIARLVQVKVLWLTDIEAIACLAIRPTVLGRSPILPAKPLQHVKKSLNKIRSINLVDRRVVTERGTVDYDYLIVDQGTATSLAELQVIRRELGTLIASVKAALTAGHKPTAVVTVTAHDAHRLQLALALSADIVTHFPGLSRKIKVRVNGAGIDEAAITFLRHQGLTVNGPDLKSPGLTIAAARPVVSSGAIRGLAIDRAGRAVTDAHGKLAAYPEVTILDSRQRPWQNLLRFNQALARRLAQSLAAVIEGEPSLSVELQAPAYLLHGRKAFVHLGSMTSGGLRARAVLGLERRLLARR